MKTILITGASRGIGRAIALRLASVDVELALHGRDRGRLEEVVAEAVARGAAARAVVADLADPAGVAAVAATVAGPLHALVHSAGVATVKPIAETSTAEWKVALDLMVTAPFLLTRALLPRLGAGSSVVNLLSVAARRGFPGWAAYCAAKFALEGFSQCLREEVRAAGVRVINVYPSATATDLWTGIAGSWPRERMLDPGEVAEAVAWALGRPPSVLVESVEVGDLSGTL